MYGFGHTYRHSCEIPFSPSSVNVSTTLGFGYFGYGGNQQGTVAADINDKMSFYIRSNIILNLKATGSDQTTILDNMFSTFATKVAHQEVNIENSAGLVYQATSGTVSGTTNAAPFSDVYNKSGSGSSAHYASDKINQYFSVPRGDSFKKITESDETKSIEFRQNWMLVVTLNSKKQA